MKPREAKGALSADLLVCFPSRTNLKLLPKPVCSPARHSEPNKFHHHNHQQLVKKSSIGRSGLGHASSPVLWAKTKPMGSEISEPTSPKVTCAGQIKVRHKSGSCKSWQSVMEEIERIHNNKKQKKQRRPGWAEALGFKKEVMQFLTCLRSIRFDLRCFGSFPQPDITSDDDEDEEEEEDENRDRRDKTHEGISDGGDQGSSRTVFSKWFMVLQENQSNGFGKDEQKERNHGSKFDGGDVGSTSEVPVAAAAVPPPNALLLMRCRSAPAKTWLEEKEEEEEEEEDDDDDEDEGNQGGENGLEKEEKKGKVTLKSLMEEDNHQRMKKENLVVMTYDSDFYKISSDIAKETWVVGGMKDAISRSRSWKR